MILSSSVLARTVWFLDYDGSLCPHQEIWEERTYDPVVIHKTLNKLKSREAELFWNTGRRAESLGSVYEPFLEIPGYFIHGSCFWQDKHDWIGPSVPESLRKAAQEIAHRVPHLKLEIKQTSLRFTPSPGKPLDEVRKALDELAHITPGEWQWISGPRGSELLARGFDKAVAVQREMQTRIGKIPIAVGDDPLDRPAIEAAIRLGGYGIVVGEGCGWVTEIPHRPDQVIFFEKPHGVLDLIDDLASNLEATVAH